MASVEGYQGNIMDDQEAQDELFYKYMVMEKDFGGDWSLTGMDLNEVLDEKEVEQWIGATLARRIGPARGRQLMAKGQVSGIGSRTLEDGRCDLGHRQVGDWRLDFMNVDEVVVVVGFNGNYTDFKKEFLFRLYEQVPSGA